VHFLVDFCLTGFVRGRMISLPVCAENLNTGVLNTGVMVMKSAQDGARTDHTGSLNRARNRRILVQGSMRSDEIVQRGLRTPTGPFFARFFIGIILGLVAEFAFMKVSTRLMMKLSNFTSATFWSC